MLLACSDWICSGEDGETSGSKASKAPHVVLMHMADQKSKSHLVGFRRHMLFCRVKVMAGTDQWSAVIVSCVLLPRQWAFLQMLLRWWKTSQHSPAELQQCLVPVCCVAGDMHSRQQRVCQEGCWVAAGTFNILCSYTHVGTHACWHDRTQAGLHTCFFVDWNTLPQWIKFVFSCCINRFSDFYFVRKETPWGWNLHVRPDENHKPQETT